MYNAYNNRRYTITTPLTYTYMLLGCICCWILEYIQSAGYPIYSEAYSTPLWNAVCQAIPNKAAAYLIGIVVMTGGAFLLHRANYILMLIREKTLLPFLLYLLLISCNPDFIPLKSASMGVFCLVLAIYQLFTSYHDETASKAIYNATLILGAGSLLWIHLLWFVPVFWYGMYCFRSLSARTFIASLLGVLTVYWLLLGWCVWQGNYTAFTVPFQSLFKIRLLQISPDYLINAMGIIYLIILLLTASINIFTHEYEDNLRTRQYLYFLMTLAIWSFALFFFYEQSSKELLETVCMPAAILLGHFFTVQQRSKYIHWFFHGTVLFYFTLSFIRLWNF